MKYRTKQRRYAQKKSRKIAALNRHAAKRNAQQETTQHNVEPDHTQQNVDEPDQQPSCSSVQTPASNQTLPVMKNKSSEKLKNSLFNKLEASPNKRYFTRKTAVDLGLKPSCKDVARGNRIVDVDILNELLKCNTICKHCKNPKSELTLLEDPKTRKGLACKLILKCNMCNISIPFNSSKKTPGNKTFQVNTRSVGQGPKI